MVATGPRARAWRGRSLGWLCVAGLAAVAGWWVVAGRGWQPRAYRARPVGTASPYRNARPGVRYVGDAACARCHGEIAAAYAHHPMGRSLAPAGTDDARGGVGQTPSYFEAQGFRYEVERRGRSLVHSETRRDARGRVVTRAEGEVRYLLGSGARGVSYLVERDGRLFQSPISWYAGPRRWDLAPSYAANNQHFTRPVGPACLYCHANRFEAVDGAINSYRPPIFHGTAIGCERCHGPGGLHAGGDDAIVNPGRLEPALREAVCEQCHLQGRARVVRAGRAEDEYRPGLPLTEFLTVFVAPPGQAASNHAVGHVEQMHESQCYRASRGRLGCVSCHDPHRLPDAAERVAFYRERCLACHSGHGRGCSLAEAERRRRDPADSCVGCHMPRASLTNVAHTAATDHRVPRRGPGASAAAQRDASADSGPPLVAFHPVPADSASRHALDRDLGVALSQWASGEVGPSRERLARQAVPLLERAARDRPGDSPALVAGARALVLLGRADEALAASEAALAFEPRSEPALAVAAPLAALAGRPADALDYLGRASAIDPWVPSYHVVRAKILAQAGDWAGAAAACRDTLRADPTDLAARRLLVRAALVARDVKTARAECLDLLALDPPDADRYRGLLQQLP